MDCARARFLIYAYLDRELSPFEGEALQRHLGGCGACSTRASSARGLARLLHSRLDRTPAPERLRARLHTTSWGPVSRPRYPLFATAAALVVMLLPLVSDVPRSSSLAAAGLVPSTPAGTSPRLVSRRLTGIFVCLECEARSEAELCPVSHAEHQTGFCAENGELWRVMSPDRGADSVWASLGRMATVEGVAFPQSGFLRVSRVGY
ncbi:MAG: anti-sigma factor family protein [Thermoanaerobaculia bacterium]